MLYFESCLVKETEHLLQSILAGLYLYFLGLSLRNVVKALSYLHVVKRSRVFFAKKWKWIKK